jgi:hypothetical protein
MRAAALPMAAAALLATAALGAGAPARAELSQQGNLIASFDGGLWPTRLPRRAPAPVAVRVAGNVRDAAGNEAQLPQLRTIAVAINRQGRLFDRGLPSCEVSAIQPSTEAGARAQCGAAIVGSGHVTAQVRIPNQPSFSVHAKLLAFNGPHRNGHRLILAQAYAREPPGAFILPFTLRQKGGLFGTVLSTTLPPSAQSWAYITHFDMTLHRTYAYRGARRSYVSAACSAPAGFRSAIFPFARATYGFDDGRRLTTTVGGRCTVRG